MTPEERQLIAGLFDRMRNFGPPEKDRDAETLIGQSVRAMPDAPYMLVQSVLVQEQALQQAGQRIEELEERVRALEGGQARGQASGGFLGGRWGSSKPAAAQGASVPAIGSRAPANANPSPWSQAGPQAQAPAASGGFMRSALATAAGVAGGMLLANSISSMLGGNSAQANPASDASGAAKGGEDSRGEQAHSDAAAYEEPDNTDFGSDFGGGDLEI